MSKKDVYWINAVKAICIIFVFFRHSREHFGCNVGGEYDCLFLTFYVNAFFFISGYLLFGKQLSEPKILEDRKTYIISGSGKLLFLNIIFKIVIPSIIFSALEFLPSCILQGRTIDVSYAVFKTIGGGTYWFTSALAVSEFVLLLLLCTRNRNIWYYSVLSLILGILCLLIINYNLFQIRFWAWRQGLIALIFLAMGGLYWRYENVFDRMMRWYIYLSLLVIYVFSVIELREFNNPLISILSIQPLGFVTSAISCLLLIWISKNLPVLKPLTFIGQYSIGFYFLCGSLPVSFSLIAHRILDTRPIWMLLAIWLSCLIIAYFIVCLINRYLPWLWDLRLLKKQR